jgi:hypothetical protein
MMHEIKHGALSITPMQQTKKVNSRLRRVAEPPKMTEAIRKEQEKIYKKMGTAIPQ